MLWMVLIIIFWACHRLVVFKSNLGKKIKLFSHFYYRYFWNTILLLTFIPTAVTGIFLFLGYRSSSLVFWHNQIGIACTIVAFLHLLERIKYFTKI